MSDKSGSTIHASAGPFIVTALAWLACWLVADQGSFDDPGALSGTCAAVIVILFGIYLIIQRRCACPTMFFMVFTLLFACNAFYQRWEYIDTKETFFAGDEVLYNVSSNVPASKAESYSIFLFEDSVYIDSSQGECQTVTTRSNNQVLASYYCVSPVLDSENGNQDNILFWAVNMDTSSATSPSCTSGSCAGKKMDAAIGYYYEAIQEVEGVYPVTAAGEDEIIYVTVSSSIESLMNEYLETFQGLLIVGLLVPALVAFCLGCMSKDKNGENAKLVPQYPPKASF